MNIGLIGVGGISAVHLKAYASIENARIVALCDKDPERASGRSKAGAINIDSGEGVATLQTKAYTDYRELLADAEVEVVDICLPTDLHAEVAIAALEAGKHVLCEKPMAYSVEQCDRMIAAADAANRILMIAQCIRFWPQYVVIKEMLDSGKYGKITSALFRRLSNLPIWSSDGWLTDPKRSGGCMLDMHIHDSDFISYLLGMPQSVRARGIEDAHGIGQVFTEYQYGNGEAIFAEGGWYYPQGFPFRMGFLVHFEGASIEWEPTRGPLTVYPEGGEPFTPELLPGTGYSQEIAYFLDCVARGVKPAIVTPWDARESVRLIYAEMESVRSGQPVAL